MSDNEKSIAHSCAFEDAFKLRLQLTVDDRFKCGRAMLRHEWTTDKGLIPWPHRKMMCYKACIVEDHKKKKHKYMFRSKLGNRMEQQME
uniref:SFRICE_005650 n=1 Tax=Spodoptera frugiperda TaxID=7108 RepID=A0A2H1VR44_SPOFR